MAAPDVMQVNNRQTSQTYWYILYAFVMCGTMYVVLQEDFGHGLREIAFYEICYLVLLESYVFVNQIVRLLHMGPPRRNARVKCGRFSYGRAIENFLLVIACVLLSLVPLTTGTNYALNTCFNATQQEYSMLVDTYNLKRGTMKHKTYCSNRHRPKNTAGASINTTPTNILNEHRASKPLNTENLESVENKVLSKVMNTLRDEACKSDLRSGPLSAMRPHIFFINMDTSKTRKVKECLE